MDSSPSSKKVGSSLNTHHRSFNPRAASVRSTASTVRIATSADRIRNPAIHQSPFSKTMRPLEKFPFLTLTSHLLYWSTTAPIPDSMVVGSNSGNQLRMSAASQCRWVGSDSAPTLSILTSSPIASRTILATSWKEIAEPLAMLNVPFAREVIA